MRQEGADVALLRLARNWLSRSCFPLDVAQFVLELGIGGRRDVLLTKNISLPLDESFEFIERFGALPYLLPSKRALKKRLSTYPVRLAQNLRLHG